MKINRKYYLFLILLLSVYIPQGCCGCRYTENTAQTEKGDFIKQRHNSLLAEIKSQLGENYNTVYNSSKKFALAIQNENPDVKTKFIVYSLTNDEIVLSDGIINGDVRWETEYDLVVTEFPGMIKKNEESNSLKYRFNVVTKIKSK